MKYLILFITFGFIIAAAPPNPDPSLAPFYQGLKQPGTHNGCCSMADCRNVQYRIVGKAYEVFIDKNNFTLGPDKWVSVPANAVLPPQTNPTGEAVACWVDGLGVLCFLEASGT